MWKWDAVINLSADQSAAAQSPAHESFWVVLHILIPTRRPENRYCDMSHHLVIIRCQPRHVAWCCCWCSGAGTRVERDESRRPKTYAVRVQFSLFLICWVEREKLLFLLFKSGFDDAMNMENDNINNSLECLKWSKHHKTEVLIHNF